MCVIWLNDSRARSWSAPTSIQQVQTPGLERNSRGGGEEKDESMKRKQYLGLFVCLYLQSSLPRKARDILFLGPHPRKPLPLRSYEATPALGRGWDVTTEAFSSLLSSPPPLPVSLNWFSPGSKWPLCLLFLPFPCIPNEGMLSVHSIFIICISQNLAGCLWSDWKQNCSSLLISWSSW